MDGKLLVSLGYIQILHGPRYFLPFYPFFFSWIKLWIEAFSYPILSIAFPHFISFLIIFHPLQELMFLIFLLFLSDNDKDIFKFIKVIFI